MDKSTKILNHIRSEASEEYKTKVPQATSSNYDEVGRSILSYTPVMNEFIDGLVQKVGKTVYANRMAINKLKEFKKGMLPFGAEVEEMHVDITKAESFDGEGSDTLKRKKPQTKVAYHKLNRQDVYQVTLSHAQVKSAFTTGEGVAKLLDILLSNLYSSSNHDEYILTKKLLGTVPTTNTNQFVTVTPVTDETSAKKFMKDIKKTSSALSYMSDKYNQEKVNNYVPKEEQIILMRSDYLAECDVEVLASALQLQKADFNSKVIELDCFFDSEGNEDSKTVAMIVDREFLQIYDTVFEMTQQQNAKGLFFNYFLHHQQVLATSPFRNSVTFKTA